MLLCCIALSSSRENQRNAQEVANPKLLSKEKQATKLGDAVERHPLFLLMTIGILLGAIFLFVTCHESLLGASCMI